MIFLACLLTVVIETPFLMLLGYRGRENAVIIICANVLTNLCLNMTVQLAFHGTPGLWVYPMEALVVAAEYGIYRCAFGPSFRLLLQTLAANALSYGIGLLIF